MNPIKESLIVIAQAEFSHEMRLAVDKYEKIMGDTFDDTMRSICDDIEALRKQCKDGTSFIEAGVMLCVPNTHEELQAMTPDERHSHDEGIAVVKAAIAWKILHSPAGEEL